MSPQNNSGKTPGGDKEVKPELPPKAPPRPRVVCPGCSTELPLHEMLSPSSEIVYASMTDMKKLGIECQNESCPIYIEGVDSADDKVPVNPVVEKCVQGAMVERAAIEAAHQKQQEENKKREREEEEAEYAKYDPFSGAKEKEAEKAIQEDKRQKMETEKIVQGWEKIQNAPRKVGKKDGATPSGEE